MEVGPINSSSDYTLWAFYRSCFKGINANIWGARWSSGQCARRAIAEAKHRSQWPVLGWVTKKIYHLELLRASEGTLSRWSRRHLHSLTPTNPHWARVVGYGPLPLWVIHKEGLCPSSGDINRLMMNANIELQVYSVTCCWPYIEYY
jgi:hypothetical protein